MKALLCLKKFLFLSLFLALTTPLSAQQTKLLTAEKHNEYGLVYSLPITALRIDVVAVKETKIAGPFSKYSKIFTTDTKVIAEDEVNWTIESVNVSPYGIANTDETYLMQLKPGATTYIGVAEDGMLLSINKEPESYAESPITIDEIEGTVYNGKEYLEFVNEDFISAISSFKKAQLLAEEIMEIRDAKISLTRGTAETMPTDGKQLEIMLSSLENQEKALVNAFTGSSWKERIVKTFSFVPAKEGKNVLFRISDENGIVDADVSEGKPVYLSVAIEEEAELPVDSKGEEKKLPKDGVMYCIPGVAQVSISLGTENLYSGSIRMSQFGFTFGLNPALFTDKKEPSFAIFDPSTGALKELGTLKP